jgi:hypothetical protein
VVGILFGVGMLIEIMTMTGLRGAIVIAALVKLRRRPVNGG